MNSLYLHERLKEVLDRLNIVGHHPMADFMSSQEVADAVIAALYAPHPGEHHVFAIACDQCGVPGRVTLSLHGDDEPVVTLTAKDSAERRLAYALLTWFDTTHGSTIGEHDHHCPANKPDGKGCTCGWQAVSDADHART